jgi:flagellar L-ring protein precursor FlgH
MNMQRSGHLVLFLAAFGLLGWSMTPARAQSSSLMGNPDQRRPLSLGDVSWTYQAPEAKREIRLNDLITVNVNEKATVIAGGKIDQQRQAEGNWTLKSWIVPMKGNLGVVPDPQTNGSPNIDGTVNNTYRANADLQSKESLTLKLACHVVDIRPNGTLVLEGRRTIAVNDQNWEVSLSGSIRTEDVQPNNNVSSENVADLRLVKRETGQVRDGYKRGFITTFLDKYAPF